MGEHKLDGVTQSILYFFFFRKTQNLPHERRTTLEGWFQEVFENRTMSG
jgi:hypothetical protein